MVANDCRPKLTIRDVQTIFQCKHWKCNKNAGGLKVKRAVPEKHIINFLWPNYYCMFSKNYDTTQQKETAYQATMNYGYD